MNCPICHAEMVLDYKIKIENGILFNLVTIKKKNDQKKVKAAFCPSCGKIELYTDIPSGEKNKHIQFPGC
jgi:Zn-finger nucleic acid-binding protein